MKYGQIRSQVGAFVPTIMKPVLWRCHVLHRLPVAQYRVLPDFLIIGAQKAGTSSLYRYLISHSQVRRAARKEIHYFDENFRNGPNWYRAHFPFDRSAVFKNDCDRTWITGEASPLYLFHPLAARRAASVVPDAKLIVLLRNPVDRALSHYHNAVFRRIEDLSFEEALEAEPARLRDESRRVFEIENYWSQNLTSFSYLSRGKYASQLAEWMKYFPQSQFLIMKFEDVIQNPKENMTMLFEFLKISASYTLEFKTYNARNYRDMDPKLRKWLVEYFRPHNRDLTDLVAKEFDWG